MDWFNLNFKMNILILAAGAGKRFSDEGYSKPKPLINFCGKPIIFWLLDNLSHQKGDQFVIVYNNKLDKYRFTDLIRKRYPAADIKFKSLDVITRGPAETASIAVEMLERKEDPTIILDCDNFYKTDILESARQYNTNLIFYFKDNQSKPLFSYIKFKDFSNDVIDIAEKIKISDNANTGAYCFKDANVLQKYAKNALEDCNINREIYISDVYKKMLFDNCTIKSCLVDDYVCLGTPEQLRYQSQNTKNNDNLIFCFDLDNTLVTYPKITGNYSTVEPLQNSIDFCNLMYDMGYKVIIHTARRMKTCCGDVQKVREQVEQITVDKLKQFGIKYHELIFGKPYADFYIDDLAVNSCEDLSKETGFYNIYDKERSTNKILITDNKIHKITNNLGECYWYNNIPEDLKDLFPQAVVNENNIVMEKIEGIPYSYMFVNDLLSFKDIDSLILNLQKIHSHTEQEKNINIYLNYYTKIKNRYETYNYSCFDNSHEVYTELSNNLQKYENTQQAVKTRIHGDPVFTNIFKTLTGENKFIDMRGKIGDIYTIYGDKFYDYAKVYQSLCGYDFILKDKTFTETADGIKKYFETRFVEEYGYEKLKWLKILTSSLLFSLIPLHTERHKQNKYIDLSRKIIKEL
jgi:choline kinase